MPLTFLNLGPDVVSNHADESDVGTHQVHWVITFVIVGDVGETVLGQEQWGLGVSGVSAVQWLPLQALLQVVSDDVHLMEPTPESLGGGDVVDISDTEDVAVLLVSEGVWVDVQEEVAFFGREARFDEGWVWLAWGDEVQVVIWSG